MAARLSLPRSQQRHSNVAVVRLSNDGVTLEVPCYKNKVLAYRQGLESDLNEVLQISRVFTNVSRGEFASLADIRKALGAKRISEDDAIRRILVEGNVQVGAGERQEEVSVLRRDVVSIVSQKCVHPLTRRPYPFGMIDQALDAIGFSIRLDQDAKPQALRAMHDLCARQVLPIRRAPMNIRICTTDPAAAAEYLRQQEAENILVRPIVVATAASNCASAPASGEGAIAGGGEAQTVAATDASGGDASVMVDVVADVSPDLFRTIDAWVLSALPAGSSLAVITPCVIDNSEGDASAFSQTAGVFSSATAIHATQPPAAPSAHSNSSGSRQDVGTAVSAIKPSLSASASRKGGAGRVGGGDDAKNIAGNGRRGGATAAAAAAAADETSSHSSTAVTASNPQRQPLQLSAKQRVEMRKQTRGEKLLTERVHGRSASDDEQSDSDNNGDDDAGRRGRRKGKGKGKPPATAATTVKEPHASASDSDSEDENDGLNRKQREAKRRAEELRAAAAANADDDEAWKDGLGDEDDE